MKKKFKILLCVVVCFCILVTIIPYSVYSVRGRLNNGDLPENFEEEILADAFVNTADVRIMSSNLLVHYKSWGGLPAKPRANRFIEMLNAYKPDVIGVQELCDEWYCCINNNLPDGYKMLYPLSTGAFVRMTAIIYNSDALNLIDSGNFAYDQNDNPRLRRVIWAVFETKATGKQFAVTNTHFDLLREGREEELTQVMNSQTDELLNCVENISNEYSCPVFSVGDFNTMEDTEFTKPIDIPAIYNRLSQTLTDTKFVSENKIYGSEQDWGYPSYDHIFLNGNADTKNFCIMSYDYLTDMSDHYPIFADIILN
ncbi:MAG: hypothetical protein K2L19_00465 [Eubacterium sp.]|nr:hypothetical protein [Eubacterium sp.]